jgi:small-conductance mechanosensitive channel
VVRKIAPEVIVAWVGRGLGAIVATIFVIWLIGRMGRILRNAADRIEARLRKRGRGLSFRSVEVLSADAIIQFARSAVGITRVTLSFTAFYLWIVAVAGTLDRSHRVFDVVVKPLVTAVSGFWSATVAFVPNLLTLMVIVVAARFATRAVDTLSTAVEEERLHITGIDAALAAPTRRLVTIGIWLLALVMAVPYLPGSDSRAFQGIAIMMGVLLSLGSSSVVGNLLSGLVLTYTRAYRVGDRVRINEVVGDVVSLGAFTTRLRTIKDEEVVIPNAIVQSGVVQNFSKYSLNTGVQVHTQVTIGYEVPWRTVHRLLVSAARATDGVREAPEPYVLQRALDDFYVRYEICAFTDQAQSLHLTEGKLCQAIQDAFFREGVEICSPHYHSFRDGSRAAIPDEMRGKPKP